MLPGVRHRGQQLVAVKRENQRNWLVYEFAVQERQKLGDPLRQPGPLRAERLEEEGGMKVWNAKLAVFAGLGVLQPQEYEVLCAFGAWNSGAAQRLRLREGRYRELV